MGVLQFGFRGFVRLAGDLEAWALALKPFEGGFRAWAPAVFLAREESEIDQSLLYALARFDRWYVTEPNVILEYL